MLKRWIAVGATLLFALACADSPTTPEYADLGNPWLVTVQQWQAKADVCHRDDDGAWGLISVAPQAIQAHLDHGDGTPGQFVPGTGDTQVFGPNCELSPRPDYALEFLGTKNTSTPDANALDLAGDWTIELWIKPTDAAGGRQDLVSKWGYGTDASYDVWMEGGLLKVSTRQEPTNSLAVGTVSLQNGVWQHIAVTFSSGTVQIYIDGVAAGTTAGMFSPQNSVTSLSLGREWSTVGYTCCYYQGLMDDVRIWNVTRTQAEVQAAMGTTLTGSETGLIAYWPMDEGSGDIAYDATGNGHDMQLGNVVGPDAADPVWISPGHP